MTAAKGRSFLKTCIKSLKIVYFIACLIKCRALFALTLMLKKLRVESFEICFICSVYSPKMKRVA